MKLIVGAQDVLFIRIFGGVRLRLTQYNNCLLLQESESNGKQINTYQFHKGVVEGIWWSFVTMTTVG